MNISYRIDEPVSKHDFISILERSSLAERRPVDDDACIEGMLKNSNLCVTAWDGNKLIGIARCVTDFHYCCYLSDLAVDQRYQSCGVGKALQQQVQEQLGPRCKLILIAAPAANSYYDHIGYSNNDRCWILQRDETIES